LPIAGRDVRYRPTDFFAYRLLQVGTEQMQQTRQNTAAEYKLSLDIIACHYITNGSQRRRHDARRLMPGNSYIKSQDNYRCSISRISCLSTVTL